MAIQKAYDSRVEETEKNIGREKLHYYHKKIFHYQLLTEMIGLVQRFRSSEHIYSG